MCDYCQYNVNDILNVELTICKTCFNSDTVKLITKTHLMQEYKLTNNDLANVRKIEYIVLYVSYLYLIKDIEHLAKNKHGTLVKLEEKKQQTQQKIKLKKEYEQKIEDIRKKNLEEYLKSIGLNGIRPDSELCTNFIKKGENSGYSLIEIGKILKEMEFYHTYTKYSSMLRNVIHNEIQDIKEWQGWYHWTDKDELISNIKYLALKDYIKQNYKNEHKLILELPDSLKETAYKIINSLPKKKAIL